MYTIRPLYSAEPATFNYPNLPANDYQLTQGGGGNWVVFISAHYILCWTSSVSPSLFQLVVCYLVPSEYNPVRN